MPTPTMLEFPDDKKTLIWDAVKIVIKESPFLKPVKTFHLREGHPDEEKPLTASICPWLRITPTNAQTEQGPKGTIKDPLIITFEYAVAGRNIRNLINMWGAIQNAFMMDGKSPDPDKTLYQYLKDYPGDAKGIYEPVLKMSGLTPEMNTPGYLKGSGLLRMNLLKFP